MAENELDFEFEPRMSDADALMWSIEKDPLLRSTITTVFLLDRRPDRRALPPAHGPGQPPGPPPPPAGARPPDVGRATPLGDRPELRPRLPPPVDSGRRRRAPSATCSTWPSRSPCKASTGPARSGSSRSSRGCATASAAVIAKIHHSITDGVGGVKLLMELLDLERTPGNRSRACPPNPSASSLSERKRFTDALAYETARNVRGITGLVGCRRRARSASSSPTRSVSAWTR